MMHEATKTCHEKPEKVMGNQPQREQGGVTVSFNEVATPTNRLYGYTISCSIFNGHKLCNSKL